MRALITGGGGFIGGAIARALRDRGDEVRSLGRRPQPALSALGVHHVEGNLTNEEDVASALAGCDAVFHVAAKVGLEGHRDEFVATNVTGTEHVLEGCQRHGVGRLIFTSSPSVVIGEDDLEGADESTPYPTRYRAFYPETKAEAERRVLAANREGGLRTISLRPHIVYGPGDTSLLPRLLERASRLRRIGPDGKKTDISYIDDVVQAHLLAADVLATRPDTVGGKPYFISSGEPVEIWEFVDRMLETGGKGPVRGRLPKPVAMWAAHGLEFAHRSLKRPGEPLLSAWVVKELTTSHWFSIEAARRDLGYAPKVGLDEGMRRLAAHLAAQTP